MVNRADYASWLRKQSWSEPVSGARFSLLDGNLQGNWAISRQGSTAWTADPEGFRRLGPKFPNQLSRDFPTREQRIGVGGSASEVPRSRKWPFSRHFGARGGKPGGENPSPELVKARFDWRTLPNAG